MSLLRNDEIRLTQKRKGKKDAKKNFTEAKPDTIMPGSML